MNRNLKHPWALAKREGKCLAFQLGADERKLWMRSAKPFSGCDCLWCMQATVPEQPLTLWPACSCATCESHILWRQPEHFMRQCKHGKRWTIDQEEDDDCSICRLDELEYKIETTKQELSNRIEQAQR